MAVTAKPCTQCKQTLPLDAFSYDKRMKLGRTSQCRECSRQWHKARPGYVQKKNAEWRRKNPTYSLDWARRTKLGVTPDDVARMMTSQHGKCAGCTRSFGAELREHVDHCHTTGRVRGLLCRRCNVSLGHFDDDPTILRRLADYLEAEEWL